MSYFQIVISLEKFVKLKSSRLVGTPCNTLATDIPPTQDLPKKILRPSIFCDVCWFSGKIKVNVGSAMLMTGLLPSICPNWNTVFENHRKSLIQHCERSELRLHVFWVDKSWLKIPKMVHFGDFLKTLSLRSNSITRQVTYNKTKNVGKCQNKKKCDILRNFQTMW